MPSFALELGLSDKGDDFVNTGLGVESMALSFQRSGQTATLQLVGQKETRGSSGGGTPTTATFTRFGQFQGTIRKDGTTLEPQRLVHTASPAASLYTCMLSSDP